MEPLAAIPLTVTIAVIISATISNKAAMINDIRDKNVQAAFMQCPEGVAERLLALRKLILDVADELVIKDKLVETLKWGQPSYITARGSTIRISSIKDSPHQYGMYCHCQTSLIDTFREIYPDCFHFEGKRAIIWHLQEELAVKPLRHCIRLAFTYHDVKHLPLLGA